ncbi:MAG: hypothetical protein ACYDDF_01530 [Thermoplasmatota archaeon]
MLVRRSGWLAAAVIVLAPLAAASASGGPLYDPLAPHIQYYFEADKNQTNVAPNGTSTAMPVALATPPATTNPPTVWTVKAAHTYMLTAPISVRLFVSTTAPVFGPPEPAGGPAFTAQFLLNGKAVSKNATWTPTGTPSNVIFSGAPVAMNFTFAAPNVSVTVGDVLGVSVQFSWPPTTSASGLQYEFGPQTPSSWATTAMMATFNAILPTHLPGSTYNSPAASIPAPTPGRVALAAVENPRQGFAAVTTQGTVGQTIELRMQSMDDPTVGASHEDGTGGLENPYRVAVSGAGVNFTENLYPAEWVIHPFTPTAAGVVSVRCISGCPNTTAFATVQVTQATTSSTGSSTGTTGETGGSGSDNTGGTGGTGSNGTTTSTAPTSSPPASKGLFGIPAPATSATLVAGIGAAIVVGMTRRR